MCSHPCTAVFEFRVRQGSGARTRMCPFALVSLYVIVGRGELFSGGQGGGGQHTPASLKTDHTHHTHTSLTATGQALLQVFLH